MMLNVDLKSTDKVFMRNFFLLTTPLSVCTDDWWRHSLMRVQWAH